MALRSGSFNNSGAVISDDSLKGSSGQATTSIEPVIFWLLWYERGYRHPENTGHFAGYDE
ncbi:putative type II/III secretion system protein [Escherichia coli]|nr:putative type II/III secretion system protein [Escherichia coli]